MSLSSYDNKAVQWGVFHDSNGEYCRRKILDMSKHDSMTTKLNTRYTEPSWTKISNNMLNNHQDNINKNNKDKSKVSLPYVIHPLPSHSPHPAYVINSCFSLGYHYFQQAFLGLWFFCFRLAFFRSKHLLLSH